MPDWEAFELERRAAVCAALALTTRVHGARVACDVAALGLSSREWFPAQMPGAGSLDGASFTRELDNERLTEDPLLCSALRELVLEAPPFGGATVTSRALLMLGVEVDGRLLLVSIYERAASRSLDVHLFHAETGLATQVAVREDAWAGILPPLAELSSEERDRVCHAVTDALGLEAEIDGGALSPALRRDVFEDALRYRASVAPAPLPADVDPTLALDALSREDDDHDAVVGQLGDLRSRLDNLADAHDDLQVVLDAAMAVAGAPVPPPEPDDDETHGLAPRAAPPEIRSLADRAGRAATPEAVGDIRRDLQAQQQVQLQRVEELDDELRKVKEEIERAQAEFEAEMRAASA